MMEETYRRMIDAEQGGIAARVEALHPIEIATLLRLVPTAHIAPPSELAVAVERWLQSECMLGDGLAMTHRGAVAAFERFAGQHHCRRAFGRALASHGFSFAVVRGRRKWFGAALRERMVD